MDEANRPGYPPGYPDINPQYLQYLKGEFDREVQNRVDSAHQDAQEKLASTEADWRNRLEENKKREALLEEQVEELKRLVEAGNQAPRPLTTGLQPESSAARPVPIRGPPGRMRGPSLPPPAQGRSSSQPLTTSYGPIGRASSGPPTEPEASVRRLGEHQLASKDVPQGAAKLKESLELHIRMLWGHLSTTSKPPEVDRSQLAEFNTRFSENLNESDLAQICAENPSLVSPSLVQIQASIPLTIATAQSRILSGARRFEEFVLEYIQAVISKFGLTRWCPDLTQSPGSVYNSACRIIALDTFRQAVASQQYRLGPAEKFLKNMPLLIGIYNNFVHHRMRKTFNRELLHPGKTKQLAANNPAYQNRYRLCQSRVDFLKSNGYKRYLKYLDPKATSDDEVDPSGSRVQGRPVHFIKVRPERSAAMNVWIRLLDQERELAAMYEGKSYRQERVRIVPDDPTATAFPLLPLHMPIDYYDPAFFNSLQPGLRKKIAGEYPTVGLLQDVSHSFGHGPGGRPHVDEKLSDRVFNKKHREEILHQYRLDDLDNVDDFDSEEDEDDDEVDDEEIDEGEEEDEAMI